MEILVSANKQHYTLVSADHNMELILFICVHKVKHRDSVITSYDI